jgi:pimeloyl-ACP methyl ester carboxylesterase
MTSTVGHDRHSVVEDLPVEAGDALAADMRAVSYHDLTIDRLPRMQPPALLLQGAISPAITHAMSIRLRALLPQAQRVTIEGCLRMGPVQMPAAIAAAIHQAITSSRPARA